MHGSRDIDYYSCVRAYREVWGPSSIQGIGKMSLACQSLGLSVVSYPRRIPEVWPRRPAQRLPGKVQWNSQSAIRKVVSLD